MKNNLLTQKDIYFAKQLKYYRIKSDYKQSLMAELLGINSQQQYSRLEKGQVHFTDEMIVKICEAFDLNKLDFINLTYYEKILKPNSAIVRQPNISDSNINTGNDIKSQESINLLVEKRKLQEQIKSINKIIGKKIVSHPDNTS